MNQQISLSDDSETNGEVGNTNEVRKTLDDIHQKNKKIKEKLELVIDSLYD